MPSLEQGRIVWAEVPDSQGQNPKCRPVVILTPSNQVPAGDPLLGVAITTQLPAPLPAEYVELPWHNQGHVRTRLRQRCAAVCTWIVQFQETEIRERAGIVPGKQLREIVRIVSGQALP